MTAPYSPRRAARSRFEPVRGLRCHLLEWGTPSPPRPTLVLLHGWMDVGASFQFVVDAMAAERHCVALDWRGYGRTEGRATDSYVFADYLGDLDAVLDAVSGAPVDLLGHSMGANIAMIYAGVRPQRVRRLVNLEGFGMPATQPADAPKRYARWLDDLRTAQTLRSYANADEVAQRLMQNNPRLAADKAAWLSRHWAAPRDDGRWHLLADAAHRRVDPVLYRVDEVLECWRRIEAPVLWIEGDSTDTAKWWGNRYPRAEFEARIAQVRQLERAVLSDAGHMLHHDQPGELARRIDEFLA